MSITEDWSALTPRRRAGLIACAVAMALAIAAAATWLLRDPHVPLAAESSAERLALLSQELDREKVAYRIADDGRTLEVPRSQLGKARALAAAGGLGLPPSVGLELFKDTDFSTTDFAQKINYQRALQGELTRTVQTLAGVRSARVHVILAEGGLLKRTAGKASAAIGVAMVPGKVLTRAQVRGIQRLVAASVPDIQIDDVVVFDESGGSLTGSGNGAGNAAGDGLSSSQLDVKRQVDGYLEGKLARLLQDVTAPFTPGLSVDATLDLKQLRITTDEPIAAAGPKDADRPAGVLIKERQIQRPTQTAADAEAADNSDWEAEYKVGHRVEQMLSEPGSIKRLSVAVVLQGAPSGLTAAALEQLVAHGVGIDRARGDSVSVLLMPAPASAPAVDLVSFRHAVAPQPLPDVARTPAAGSPWIAGGAAVSLAGLLAVAVGARHRRQRSHPAESIDVDEAAARIRRWLEDGSKDDDARKGADDARP